jgi:hypothetical protein
MPSISNYLDATQILVDAIVDTADQRHHQQSCHTSTTTLAINAIVNIDVDIVNQAAARLPLPLTPPLTSIVDTSINKAAARHPQPPPLPSTPSLTASKSRHVYAPAVLFDCRQQTIQISEVGAL